MNTLIRFRGRWAGGVEIGTVRGQICGEKQTCESMGVEGVPAVLPGSIPGRVQTGTDEPPITANGGNIIGGEVARNEQSAHEGQLRRLMARKACSPPIIGSRKDGPRFLD